MRYSTFEGNDARTSQKLSINKNEDTKGITINARKKTETRYSHIYNL